MKGLDRGKTALIILTIIIRDNTPAKTALVAIFQYFLNLKSKNNTKRKTKIYPKSVAKNLPHTSNQNHLRARLLSNWNN